MDKDAQVVAMLSIKFEVMFPSKQIKSGFSLCMMEVTLTCFVSQHLTFLTFSLLNTFEGSIESNMFISATAAINCPSFE